MVNVAKKSSVSNGISTAFQNVINAGWKGRIKFFKKSIWDRMKFVLQNFPKFINGRARALPTLHFQVIPDIFDYVEVGGSCWPVWHHSNTRVFHVLFDFLGYVAWSIILLENIIFSEQWGDVILQNGYILLAVHRCLDPSKYTQA